MPFTSPGMMKSVGSLDEESTTGRVKDRQMDSAIIYAEVTMRALSLKTSYDTVLAYNNASTDSQKETKRMYELAESCFALGRLPQLLTSAQLAATGLIKTFEVGKESRTFASQNEKDAIAANWIKQAYDALSKYLDTSVTDSAGTKQAFVSKNKSVSVMSI